MRKCGIAARCSMTVALLMIAGSAWAVTIPVAARGGKVVSLQAPAGTLTITVSKRDLNIYEGADTLTATLFTADGEIASTLEIPDDGNAEKGGGAGDVQTDTMTVEIVYFMPPAWPFKITASALHDPGRQKMPLLDEQGQVIHVFDLASTGEDMVLEVERGARGGLWHFEIAHLDVKISAVGVTEWTTEPDAYFVAAGD